MEWVETTGRTVEEAKDAALDQLGVDETDAEFVVVSEPKTGLFGRMRGEARVRARVRPTSPRPKRTRSRRPEQRRQGGRGPGTGNGGRGDAGRSSSGASTTVAVAESDSATGGGSEGNGAAPGPRKRRRRGSGGGSAGGGGNGKQNEARSGTAGRSRNRDSTEEDTVGEVLSLEEQGETARAFIEGLLTELGLQGAVTARVVDSDTAEVAVDGSELGVLIGPSGATLAALQELARTVVQRRTGGHSERILVDVAGYRAKRAAALQRFTSQVADEVLASGSERALEPMSASDRKVVHDAVNDIDGVSTRSEGEDPRRYIVISPDAGGPAEDAADFDDGPGDDAADDSGDEDSGEEDG